MLSDKGNTPLQVSVIIPTYNRRKDVDECLDSIIIQTALPREVIIVDDSDNDEIENLIGQRREEFEGKDIDLRLGHMTSST